MTVPCLNAVRYWNVKWADADFVDEHPINKDDTARSLLKCLVTKKTQYLGFNYDSKNETLVAAGMIRELFEILGFKHIFDYNHTVDTLKVTSTKLDALLNSEFIKSYGRALGIFKIDRKSKKFPEWNANKIMQSVVLALKRANLTMTNKQHKVTIEGKRQSFYIYQLEKESVEKASEMVLLSLKTTGWKSDLYPNIIDFMTTLDAAGYNHYKKYLSLPLDISTRMQDLTFEDESSDSSSSSSDSNSVSSDSSIEEACPKILRLTIPRRNNKIKK